VKAVVDSLNEAAVDPSDSSPDRDGRPSCKVRLNFGVDRPATTSASELSKSNMNLATSLNVNGHETCVVHRRVHHSTTRTLQIRVGRLARESDDGRRVSTTAEDDTQAGAERHERAAE